MHRAPHRKTSRNAKQPWSANCAVDVRFASPHPRLIALETEGRYRPSMTHLLTLHDKMIKMAPFSWQSRNGGGSSFQPSMTAIASISTIASGSASRLIWTVVLVGVACPK